MLSQSEEKSKTVGKFGLGNFDIAFSRCQVRKPSQKHDI